VFLNDAASGETLGYYGVLLGRSESRWYWVRVPAIGRVIKLSGADILVFQDGVLRLIDEVDLDLLDSPAAAQRAAQSGSEWRPASQKWVIAFETSPQQDNAELRGEFRVGAEDKGKFEFRKRAQSKATYSFSMPATSCGRGRLRYFVPADCVLNRDYVMLALAEILNVEPLQV
jgi:hypothetical protein